MKNIFLVLVIGFLIAGCNLQKTSITPETNSNLETTPTPESINTAYTPSDPIEIFLVEMTKELNVAFENPIRSDILWNEGESSSALKVFFGDSFLIREPNSTLEKEKLVADYLLEKGFTTMKFNGSVGENSKKMGYRKGDLICKTDYDQYPDETDPHLIVYCSDATKGTLRK